MIRLFVPLVRYILISYFEDYQILLFSSILKCCFVSSGLLVSYLSFRQMERRKRGLPLFKFYFHRFWRRVNRCCVCFFISLSYISLLPDTYIITNKCRGKWGTCDCYLPFAEDLERLNMPSHTEYTKTGILA